MKKNKIIFVSIIMFTISIIIFSNCGRKKIELSENEELLIDKTWILKIDTTKTENTDETLIFNYEQKDKNQFNYEITILDGILENINIGTWKLNSEQNEIIMNEWDNEQGNLKTTNTFKIIKLTKDSLIISSSNFEYNKIYIPK